MSWGYTDPRDPRELYDLLALWIQHTPVTDPIWAYLDALRTATSVLVARADAKKRAAA